MDNDSKAAVREQIDPDSPEASQHPAAAPRSDEGGDGRGAVEAVSGVGELVYVRRLLLGLCILASLAVAWFASVILIPLAAAMLINFLFKPLVRRLEWSGLPPPLTAMLIMILLFVALLTVGTRLWGSLTQWVEAAPQSIERLEQKLASFELPLRQVTEATERVEDIAEDDDGEVSEPVEVRVKESAFPSTVFTMTTTVVAGFVITLVIAFFLLASGDLLLRQLVQSLPSLQDKKEAVQAFYDLESHVSMYLVTVALINAGLAVVVWAVLYLLGVPYAMWWGITAGAANFIPYLGPLVAAVAIFAASVLAFDTVGQALVPPLAFVALSSIEGYIVTPTIVGRRLSLNPLILILWLVFWGWLWGIAGALLAVPMLVCFKIICDHVEAMEPISHLLSGYVRKLGDS